MTRLPYQALSTLVEAAVRNALPGEEQAVNAASDALAFYDLDGRGASDENYERVSRAVLAVEAIATRSPATSSSRRTDVLLVNGSGGARYALQRRGDGWACSCPGYAFRRRCRHVAAQMQSAGAGS